MSDDATVVLRLSKADAQELFDNTTGWADDWEYSEGGRIPYLDRVANALKAALAADAGTGARTEGRTSMKMTAMDFTGVPIHEGVSLDYPTAWAIHNEVGPTLDHHPRCSSVPRQGSISGPGFLCDCGAVEREWKARQAAGADRPDRVNEGT